ncbi:MAG: SPASM domain-containing protein, partial [Myxococcota bacterium]
GNYQDNTISGFGPLIARLAEARMPQGTQMSFTPALETLSASAGSGSGACTWSGSAYQYRVALHDEILRHGFAASPLNVVGPCGFHNRHMYAIDYDGNIFKCPGFLGSPEWRVGHVADGLTERYEQMLQFGVDGRCGDCAHRPNCAGGCIAHEMMATGSTDVINCELEYFDSIKDDAVVRSYLLNTCEDHSAALSEFPRPPVALPAKPAQRGIRPQSLRVL